MSKVKWSPAQKAQRRRFKMASAYAKAAMADPTVRAAYEQKARKSTNAPGIWQSLITSKGKICSQKNKRNKL
jgi:hypothetical protein